ncbi:MAG: hypothetical protein HYX61_02040 [Gammaproteobacteria bacterium]|jgi:hypothetical protein|nr:hypothetical protein [Gammaproteobacteria bacterium]
MPYFLVPEEDIKVINKDKSLIKLNAKDVLGLLSYTPETAKKNQAYVLFDSYDAAAEFALHGTTKENPEHFPIFEVELKKGVKPTPIKVDETGAQLDEDDIDEDNEEQIVLDAFEADAKDVIFKRASLKYVNKEFEDIVFSQDAKAAPKGRRGRSSSASSDAKPDADTEPKPEVKAGWLDSIKNVATHVLPSALIGTGFWYSGAVPAAAAMLTKATGFALPAVGSAAIAAQVGIAAAVGALAYGVGLGAWKFVAQPIWNAGKSAYADFKKTSKERYESNKANLTKEVTELEEKLDPEYKDKIVDLLSKRLAKAPDAAFEGDNLAKEQPKVLTQLDILRKEKALLKDIAAANDDKRKEMEAELVKKGPQFSKP